jgi:type I restriction enzyme, S subunit
VIGVPSHWEIRRLDAIADVRLGRQRSPKNHSGPNMRPYLRAANVDWHGLRLDDVKQMNFTDDEMKVYRLEPGDLLLGEASGSPDEVGKPALWNGEIAECAFQNTLLRVRSNSAEPRYLLHWFRHLALSGQFAAQSRGVGIHHIGRAKLAAWPIPLPPVEEQLRIVEALEYHVSRLDAAAAYMDAAVKLTAAYERSALLDAALGGSPSMSERRIYDHDGVDWAGELPPAITLRSGWVWRRWKDVGTSQNGKAFPSAEYSNKGIRLLRPGNLGPDGKLYWTHAATRHLPVQYRQANQNLLLGEGDVVMNLTAQSLKDDFLGRVCIVRSGDEALLNQRLARLRSEILVPEYTLTIFRSPMFRSYVKSLNKGSLIQHMFTRQIAEFWLPVPPVGDQLRCAATADRATAMLERAGVAIGNAVVRCNLLRRALLDAAFTGRLTGSHTDMEMIEELAGV